MWCRYVATELPIRYRKLVTKTSRCYAVVAALWIAGLLTCGTPVITEPNWIYYRYNDNQKMCGLHWEYPLYCIITALYTPLLSAVVLIFTGVRIRASLRRRYNFQMRLQGHGTSPPSDNVDSQHRNGQLLSRRSSLVVDSQQTTRSSSAIGTRRTLMILTCASVAYFVFWSPYVVVYLTQSFVSSFQPPSAVEFFAMWLANTNSAVNVFIYSSTNRQFRRQFLLLASRLCCSRLPYMSSALHGPLI